MGDRAVVSSRNIAVYCEQLATLLESGIPLDQALTTLGRSAPTPGLRRISTRIKRRINQGETFADAIAAEAADLPSLFAYFLEVGERSGRLEHVARSLSRYYHGQWEIARDTITGLLPTLFYFSMCYAVIIFIRYVTSGWSEATLTAELEHAAFVVGCIIMIGLIVKLIPFARRGIVAIASVLPVLSGIMRQYALSRFAMALSASLAAGLDVRRAIRLACNAIANPVFVGSARKAARGIDEGLTIGQALRRIRALTIEDLAFVETGEATGRLVEMLDRLAQSSQFRAVTAARAATKIFTILVYVVMLVYVALQIIGFYWISIQNITDNIMPSE
jgi:general secretion pathway protein F